MGLGLWPQAFSVRQAGDRLWSQQLLFGVAGIALEFPLKLPYAFAPRGG